MMHNSQSTYSNKEIRSSIYWIFKLLIVLSSHTLFSQDSLGIKDISGPAAVGKQLDADSRVENAMLNWYFLDSLDNKKDRFYKKTGFRIGLDYNAQIMGATQAVGNSTGASGVFRVYGKWNFVGKDTPREGGLVFKVENRHRYTENALREYGPLDVGLAGLVQSVYNNQGWRVTNLYWRQTFGTDKVVMYAGFVDITDWTDVYVVASPWSSFNNLVFATGSGALGGGYPDGSMGVMVSAWLTDNLYVIGSMVDKNGDATRFWEGFETFFGDFETVKTLELGYTPSRLNTVFFQNAHVTFWQVDESRSTPNGWGIIGSVTWAMGEKYLPFFRFGWAKDGISFYEYSISTGLAYNIAGPNTLGIGLNWNRPNESTFGVPLNNQFISELFYKWKLTHHSEVTPNIQFINNPSLSPEEGATVIFGLRARFFM